MTGGSLLHYQRQEAFETDGDDADEEAAGYGERNDGRIIASIAAALGGI